jgi:hypothetical protein
MLMAAYPAGSQAEIMTHPAPAYNWGMGLYFSRLRR